MSILVRLPGTLLILLLHHYFEYYLRVKLQVFFVHEESACLLGKVSRPDVPYGSRIIVVRPRVAHENGQV